MRKIKLGIIEDSPQITAMLKDFFLKDSEFEIVMTAVDGLEGVAKIEKFKPHVVILDIVLPELDGFGVMEAVKDYVPKFLILSALSQESFILKALKLGASYYMIKPFDFMILKKRLLSIINDEPSIKDAGIMEKIMSDYQMAEPVNRIRQKSTEEKITNIFITVGIPAHIKGYQFLREAIKMTIENPEIINCITKKLYPSIAQKYDTSSSKVERAIRHAIEVAWNRGKIENINSLFGVKVYSNNEKPTNGEFIALVADKMLIEGA
ncbi:MAG TPA: sporulation transcription factor Spo0A [Clostridiales bacterium]|nr:sporulation transcription factor Spo0A [Clostridiales bacterium]